MVPDIRRGSNGVVLEHAIGSTVWKRIRTVGGSCAVLFTNRVEMCEGKRKGAAPDSNSFSPPSSSTPSSTPATVPAPTHTGDNPLSDRLLWLRKGDFNSMDIGNHLPHLSELEPLDIDSMIRTLCQVGRRPVLPRPRPPNLQTSFADVEEVKHVLDLDLRPSLDPRTSSGSFLHTLDAGLASVASTYTYNRLSGGTRQSLS